MSAGLSTFASILERVRTPLTVAGLALLVLYGVFSRILGLNIFANIGSQGTTDVVKMLIRSVFWLATVALILGAASYVIALWIGRRLHSSVELVSARIDHSLTENIEVPEANGNPKNDRRN